MLYSRSRFSWELSEIRAAKPDGARLLREAQPPSGGCVLKLLLVVVLRPVLAAAFGRLCVETGIDIILITQMPAAAFGRLCVETYKSSNAEKSCFQPPSGGCVLKHVIYSMTFRNFSAAFGRLCVETFVFQSSVLWSKQPPSGGCVLKQKFKRTIRRPYTSRLRAAVC